MLHVCSVYGVHHVHMHMHMHVHVHMQCSGAARLQQPRRVALAVRAVLAEVVEELAWLGLGLGLGLGLRVRVRVGLGLGLGLGLGGAK